MRAVKWSREEERFLIGAFERGLRPEDICEEMGRSVQEVKRKMYRLGWNIERIGNARRESWSDAETEILKKGFESGKSVKEIASFLGRADSTVYRRASKLKLKARPAVRTDEFYYSNVLCPFFVRFRKANTIECEGIAHKSDVHLVFEKKELYEKYIGDFCCGKYKDCLLSKALYSKYE